MNKIMLILSDYRSGEKVQSLLRLDENHWVFLLEPGELAKRTVEEKGYERQVVVPEGEFESG